MNERINDMVDMVDMLPCHLPLAACQLVRLTCPSELFVEQEQDEERFVLSLAGVNLSTFDIIDSISLLCPTIPYIYHYTITIDTIIHININTCSQFTPLLQFPPFFCSSFSATFCFLSFF